MNWREALAALWILGVLAVYLHALVQAAVG